MCNEGWLITVLYLCNGWTNLDPGVLKTVQDCHSFSVKANVKFILNYLFKKK